MSDAPFAVQAPDSHPSWTVQPPSVAAIEAVCAFQRALRDPTSKAVAEFREMARRLQREEGLLLVAKIDGEGDLTTRMVPAPGSPGAAGALSPREAGRLDRARELLGAFLDSWGAKDWDATEAPRRELREMGVTIHIDFKLTGDTPLRMTYDPERPAAPPADWRREGFAPASELLGKVPDAAPPITSPRRSRR